MPHPARPALRRYVTASPSFLSVLPFRKSQLLYFGSFSHPSQNIGGMPCVIEQIWQKILSYNSIFSQKLNKERKGAVISMQV
jgi:hypothetical protein